MGARSAGAARLWTIEVNERMEGKIRNTVREVSIPMLSKQKGFIKLFVLRSKEEPNRYSWLSLWSDMKSLEMARRSKAWKDAVSKFLTKIPIKGQPEITHFEVFSESP